MIAERTRCIPPTVVGPLHAGARGVAVTGLRSGASVKVFAGSQVVASVTAGLEPSAVVTLVRALSDRRAGHRRAACRRLDERP